MTDSIASLMSANATTLVTVTYADRIHYLHELLQRAFDVEKITSAIVVSNASSSALELLEKQWDRRLHVIRLGQNTGSANGYAIGIATALANGAAFIWLMDDDNAPAAGALTTLHHQLANSANIRGSENAAVLGFRPTHQADIACGVGVERAYPPRSSFFGFHYRQLLFKIWRRISPSKTPRAPASVVSLPYAPYGGLLASSALFKRIGLPMCELVLYADDTEYTRRITANGGVIELVTAALIEDLEHSWYLQQEQPNNFLRLLQGSSDFRAYYGSRNLAWFEKNIWRSSRTEYAINKAIYLVLLKYFAARCGRHERYHLLLNGIQSGHSDQLGINSRFPL